MNKQDLLKKPLAEMTTREREVAARVSNCCCESMHEDSDVCTKCKEHCGEL